MPGLDDGCLGGVCRRADTGGAGEELPDRHRVRCVVGALVDHFQRVIFAKHRRGDLNAAGAPAIRQRHLTRAKRHLMTGDCHGFQQRAADHAFGLFIQISEVVALHDGCLGEPSAGSHDNARPHVVAWAMTRLQTARIVWSLPATPPFRAAGGHFGGRIIPPPPAAPRLRAGGGHFAVRSGNRRNAAVSDAQRTRWPRCCRSDTKQIRGFAPGR